MPPSLAMGFAEFFREVSYESHFGRDTGVLDPKQREICRALIQSGVRNVLQPLIPGSTESYEWSWSRPVRTLIVRPAVTGTLAKVPVRTGDIAIFTADEDIFDSDMVGSFIEFDDKPTHRYQIVSAPRESTVEVRGASDLRTGEFPTSKLVSKTITSATTTTITESHTTKSFRADMVGDVVLFGSNTYTILRVSGNTVTVAGDASGESGTMKVRRTATTESTNGSLGYVITNTEEFSEDMETDSDVLTISSVAHNITEFIDANQVRVDGTLATSNTATSFTIDKSFSTDYTIAADVTETTVTVADNDFFIADEHIGMSAMFLSGDLNAYVIKQVVDNSNGRSCIVEGNALSGMNDQAVAIVRSRGRLSGKPSYNGTDSTVNSTAAMFSATDVGETLVFPVGGGHYAITAYVSTTQIKVSGDAGVEPQASNIFTARDVMVVTGPSDLAADDTFSVTNTGYVYDVPDDFAALLPPMTYPEGQWYQPVEMTSESRIRIMRSTSSTSARPRLVAVRPKTPFDASVGQKFQFTVWPNPSGVFTLTYQYQILYNEIDEENPYPPGGPLMSELYLASCLAQVEQRVHDRIGIRTQTFERLLLAAIGFDKKAHTGELIGASSRRLMGGDPLLPSGDSFVTYNGDYSHE